MEDSSKQKEFSLDGILDMTCNITTFQDGYFVNSSFETAKAEMKLVKVIQYFFEFFLRPRDNKSCELNIILAILFNYDSHFGKNLVLGLLPPKDWFY